MDQISPNSPEYIRCIEALRALYDNGTTSESARKDADFYLQSFLKNPIAWTISETILSQPQLPSPFYFFAANALAYRLRSNFNDFPTTQHRLDFKTRLFGYLNAFYFNPLQVSSAFQLPNSNTPVVERLAHSLAIFMIHMISISEWNTALEEVTKMFLNDVSADLNNQLMTHWYNPQFISQLLILLRILTDIPDILADRRFRMHENGSNDNVMKALLLFKPWLLQLTTLVLYSSRPILWENDLEEKYSEAKIKFGATDANYHFFTRHHAPLLAFNSTQRDTYCQMAMHAVKSITTWAERSIITLSDVHRSALLSSFDPNAQYPDLMRSPLPPDPTETFQFQIMNEPNAVCNTNSLYVLLLNTLSNPKLSSSAIDALSQLMIKEPAEQLVLSQAMINNVQSHYAQRSIQHVVPDFKESYNFLDRWSLCSEEEKPTWIYGFITATIERFETYFKRIYNNADHESAAMRSMVLFCDFITLFLAFIYNDNNTNPSRDISHTILSWFINLLENALVPTTDNSIKAIHEAVLDTTSVTRPTSSLKSLPPQQFQMMSNMGTMFSSLYVFYNFFYEEEPPAETLAYENQTIVSRRPLITPVFGLMSELTDRVFRIKKNLDQYEQEQSHVVDTIAEYTDHTDSFYAHHAKCINWAENRTNHIVSRVSFLNPLFYRLINLIISAAQYPPQSHLVKGNIHLDSPESAYRADAGLFLLDCLDMMGRDRIFVVWFSLFAKFQSCYTTYSQRYPANMPQHPNNSRIHHTPEQLVQLSQQGLDYFRHYNSLSFEALVTDPQITTQPQHDLNNFIPKIELWDPHLAPDGWQPLEQVLWAFCVLKDSIVNAFFGHFALNRLLAPDGRTLDMNQTLELHTGRLYQQVRFHVLEHGQAMVPNGPYGNKLIEQDLVDEMDMLIFLEQLGIFFEFFIRELHRNMNSLLALQAFSIIQEYSGFLTLPFCLSKCTNLVIDPQTRQPKQSAQLPAFGSNMEIGRLLLQVLLAFTTYPNSVSTSVPPNYIVPVTQPIVHCILQITPLKSKNDQSQTTAIGVIPQYASQALLGLVSNTIYPLSNTYGEELLIFLTYLSKRSLFNAFVFHPQYFIQLHSQGAALDNNSIVPQPHPAHLWYTVSLSTPILRVVGLIPDDNQYHNTLLHFIHCLFTFVDDSYKFYTKWIDVAVPRLQMLVDGGISLPQYHLWVKLFENITWHMETLLANVLQAIRQAFVSTSRPEYFYNKGPYDALTDPRNPKSQLICNAVNDSIPFFQEIIKTFTVRQFTIPRTQFIKGEPIIENIIVDKISNIWSVMFQKCSFYPIPLFSKICPIACQAFHDTRHSSFIYLADVAIRSSISIEQIFTHQNTKPEGDFNSALVVKEFFHYFVPVVFEMLSQLLTAKHPRHVPYNLTQHIFLLTHPSPFTATQFLDPQRQRLDEILNHFPQFFPTNWTKCPQILQLSINHHPTTVPAEFQHLVPLVLSATEFSTRTHFHQIHALRSLSLENTPDVIEDFLGLILSVRYTNSQIFYSSSLVPQLLSFAMCALYSSRSESYVLALQLIDVIVGEFVYNHPNRSTFISSDCDNLQDVQYLIDNPNENIGPFKNDNRDAVQSEIPSQIRYLNYLDNFKLNSQVATLYQSLCLIMPTLFTHLFLSMLSPSRPSSYTNSAIKTNLGPTLRTVVQFIFQNLEPIALDRYDNAVEHAHLIGTMCSSMFVDYTLLGPKLQATGSVDDTNFMSQQPLTIEPFSQPVKDMYNEAHQPHVPVLTRTMADTFGLFLLPHYTMLPTVFDELYEQLHTRPDLPSSAILPQPQNRTQAPDIELIVQLSKELHVVAASQWSDADCIRHLVTDLTDLLFQVNGDREEQ